MITDHHHISTLQWHRMVGCLGETLHFQLVNQVSLEFLMMT